MMSRSDQPCAGALCFTAVVAAHVAGAAALMARWNDDRARRQPAGDHDRSGADGGRAGNRADRHAASARSKSRRRRSVEPPPPPPPKEVSVEPPQAAAEPPKKPEREKAREAHASRRRPAEHRAPVAAAPVAGASGNSNALPNWKSLLVATLERNKRYPSEARSRGEQGIAQLAFSVDRNGGVHNAHIVRSSGSLDPRWRDAGAGATRRAAAAAATRNARRQHQHRGADPLQHALSVRALTIPPTSGAKPPFPSCRARFVWRNIPAR